MNSSFFFPSLGSSRRMQANNDYHVDGSTDAADSQSNRHVIVIVIIVAIIMINKNFTDGDWNRYRLRLSSCGSCSCSPLRNEAKQITDLNYELLSKCEVSQL